MDGQLAAIVTELESAHGRLRELRRTMPRRAWDWRPAPGRWSAAECVAHLNLSSAAILPILREALREARGRREQASPRYRRDPLGWLLCKVVSPVGGLKMRAAPEFVPSEAGDIDDLLDEFERLQASLLECVREAEGLPIDRVTLVSPFDARLTYNLYSALTLIPRHQHRHLVQAERAADIRIP